MYYAVQPVGAIIACPSAKRVANRTRIFFVFRRVGLLCSLGVDLQELIMDDTTNGIALSCLFASYFAWQILHDRIYAFQDIHYDEKVGVKSMVVRQKGE